MTGALSTEELKKWAPSRRLSEADTSQLIAVAEERDDALASTAALFAHVCRLSGADPRTAPAEIAATVKAFKAKFRAELLGQAGEWARQVIDNGVTVLSAEEVAGAIRNMPEDP